jgi:malate synthase
LEDGRKVDANLYRLLREEEIAALGPGFDEKPNKAAEILDRLVLADDFVEFLTITAYEYLR